MKVRWWVFVALLIWPAFAVPDVAAPAGRDTDAALANQLAELARSIEPYRDFRVAKSRGWKQFGKDDTPLMGEHWFREGGPDYLHGMPLDFSQPSNLMYTEIAGEKVLTGVAYTVRLAPGEALPEGFAGPDDRWHVHDFEAAIDAALQDRPFLRWLVNDWIDANYRARGDNRGRVAMVHAWVTLPNPDGVFADYNRLVPYLKLGLPPAFATGGTRAAALGLNLATKEGCADGLDGALWIANVERKTIRRLKKACQDAAQEVRRLLASGTAVEINTIAESGWQSFAGVWQDLLTPEQQRRIAAMNEHGEHPAGNPPPHH